MITTRLATVAERLLETPGAAKVMFVWVEPRSDRVCVCDVRPGERASDAVAAPPEPVVYLVGRFPLLGNVSRGDVSASMNELRARAGLEPIECAMISEGGVGRSGQWEGSIRIDPAAVV